MGGNSGSPAPAFTAQVDWFKEILPDTTAPVISGVGSTAAHDRRDDHVDDRRVLHLRGRLRADDVLRQRQGRQRRAGHEPQRRHPRPRLQHDATTTRCKSKDASNNSPPSTDRTLTTAACPTMAQSDEFNGASIDMNRWTLVDPVGGVEPERGRRPGADRPHRRHPARHLDRLGQPSAAAAARAERQLRDDGEVRLDRQPWPTRCRASIVEQDANDLLRLEVHFDGADTKLFAASIVNGVASVVGDTVIRARRRARVPAPAPHRRPVDVLVLLQRHRLDALDLFTRAMTVTAVGLLAGNSGVFAPAFQARVDWFHYTPPDRTAPVISAPSVAATPGAGSTAA